MNALLYQQQILQVEHDVQTTQISNSIMHKDGWGRKLLLTIDSLSVEHSPAASLTGFVLCIHDQSTVQQLH